MRRICSSFLQQCISLTRNRKIFQPTAFPFEFGDLHKSVDWDLELHWVHGYNSKDSRNTVKYSSSGRIVYNCAAIGVCYDKLTGFQHFQREAHSDKIISLAIHPDGNICATGQVGDAPIIVVWDVNTQQTKSTLSGFHQGGVSLLQFNSDGKLLLSIGLDDQNSIAIYNWDQKSCVTTAKVGMGMVKAACFVGEKIITGGDGFLKIWTMNGNNLSCQNGNYSKEGSGDGWMEGMSVMCVEPLDENFCLATGINGEVVVWQNGKAPNVDGASVWVRGGFRHEESVDALYTNTRTKVVVTGDKDGVVAIWKWDTKECHLRLCKVFRLKDLGFDLSSMNIRSVCMMNDDELLVGTGGSEIVEVKSAGICNFSTFEGAIMWPKDIRFTVISEGHYEKEVWGLAVHPGKEEFVTAGDDNVLRLWNTISKDCLQKMSLEGKCRALAYSPLGSWNQDQPHLACGIITGKIIVVDGGLRTMNILAELHHPTQWIQEICYTFEGSRMVVGSHDNCIYVYDVNNAYSLRGRIDCFTSYVTHIDFGILLRGGETMNEKGVVVDPKGGKKLRNVEVEEIWMQVCTGDDTMSFWNVNSMEEEKSANKLKDLVFATYSQTLGFPVQGIKGNGGGKVLSVDRSHAYREVHNSCTFNKGPILATGDDLGVIRLFKYPCVRGAVPFKEFIGHNGAIRAVKFTFDKEYLISVGRDGMVCIWDTNILEGEVASRALDKLAHVSPTKKNAPSTQAFYGNGRQHEEVYRNKKRHTDQDSNTTDVLNSPNKALRKAVKKKAAREWIADTLTPQIFEELMISSFNNSWTWKHYSSQQSMPTFLSIMCNVKRAFENADKLGRHGWITTFKNDHFSLKLLQDDLQEMGSRISLNSAYRLVRWFDSKEAMKEFVDKIGSLDIFRHETYSRMSIFHDRVIKDAFMRPRRMLGSVKGDDFDVVRDKVRFILSVSPLPTSPHPNPSCSW